MKKSITTMILFVIFSTFSKAGWWIPIMIAEELFTGNTDEELTECQALYLIGMEEIQTIVPQNTLFRDIKGDDFLALSALEITLKDTLIPTAREKCSKEFVDAIIQIEDAVVEAKCVSSGVVVQMKFGSQSITNKQDLLKNYQYTQRLSSYCQKVETPNTIEIINLLEQYKETYKELLNE
jgi:hypothetical protein